MITFDLGKKNEIWLHVKGYHGSHVLIKASDPSPELLTFGAELAGFHSEARGADKVDVDYTILKNVRRSPLKRAGLVVYTDFKTICIKPNEHKSIIVD
jgi:predicted ribosome quality control (RQC) complex YloA/Tae2 family protein